VTNAMIVDQRISCFLIARIICVNPKIRHEIPIPRSLKRNVVMRTVVTIERATLRHADLICSDWARERFIVFTALTSVGSSSNVKA
jgi:hypothetical protein